VSRIAPFVLVVLGACSGPPGANTSFDWHADLTALPEAVLSVWVSPEGDQAIAVGGGREGVIFEWNGGPAWHAPLLPETGLLWWTWAEPGGTAYAVGEDATVLVREPGGAWQRAPMDGVVPPSIALYGVWGHGGHVWVVGGSVNAATPPPNAIAHFDGTTWTAEDTSALPEETIFKVWGTSADDVWVVGREGLIGHRDAAGVWTPYDSGTDAPLIAVMGRSANEVYAVGGASAGEIVKWDGVAWSPFAQTGEGLSAVWTAPGRALFVGGNRGFLARFGGSDTGDPDPSCLDFTRPVLDVDFHCMSGGPGRVLAVGADLLGGTAPWDGAIMAHGLGTADQVDYAPKPDAAPPDARPPDAMVIPDGAPDAVPPDAHWPTEGETCGFFVNDAGVSVPYCAAGLECWELLMSGVLMCTEECAEATQCSAYGPEACCRRPGFQTLTTVCIPGTYTECTP
jgi:hypothetical protein